MTKAGLAERATDAVSPRVAKKDCGVEVDVFLDAVKDALERGEGLEIRGFGTFKMRHRKPRTARNPKTGEPVRVPARAVPVFQPLVTPARAGDAGERLRGRADMRSVLSWDGSGMVFDSRNFPGIEAVFPAFSARWNQMLDQRLERRIVQSQCDLRDLSP